MLTQQLDDVIAQCRKSAEPANLAKYTFSVARGFSRFYQRDENRIVEQHSLVNNVGRILSTLDETGLSQDTRVIYTSDHGDNLGNRGLWGKSTMYEETVGVPLILTGPDVPRGNVQHVDGLTAIREVAHLRTRRHDPARALPPFSGSFQSWTRAISSPRRRILT